MAEPVKTAIRLGYRHVDTAQAYANERGVGEGVRESGVAREKIFITSKVAAENKSYESAMASIDQTLAAMQLDYIDMMIIHFPQPWVEVNQVLAHISNTPMELIQFCQENGIVVEAYSPVAHGEALKNPLIVKTAEKYGVTPAQLCIRYCIQLGLIALPKASGEAHIKENMQVDFEISEEDMKTLISCEKIKDYGASSGFPVYGGKL